MKEQSESKLTAFKIKNVACLSIGQSSAAYLISHTQKIEL